MSYQKNKNLNLCIILKLLDEAACFKREARVANRNGEDELKITFGIFVFVFVLKMKETASADLIIFWFMY